jgi:phosphonate transport system substrate-binding protein
LHGFLGGKIILFKQWVSVDKLLLAMLVTVSFSIVSAHAETQINAFVYSGVVLEQGKNPLLNEFSEWLAKKADYPLHPRFTDTYQGLSNQLREHEMALAWTCGAPFVQDQARDGQQLIAVPLFHGKPTYSSLVLTRAGRSEKTLADFKGQVFAFSDPRSNSGFVAPAFALQEQGIDINQHFRYLMHTGLHEHSIEALLAGQADVANVDEYVVVEYFKTHPLARDKLVTLERFGPFPFTPIVAGSKVPKVVIARLQRALTTMSEDPQGVRILKAFDLDGFVVKPDSFYQPIATMLKALDK